MLVSRGAPARPCGTATVSPSPPVGAALLAMQRLRDLGVSLTIDDFGTGYSSLSRLAEFPIESLKIPKPFVDKLLGEDADEAFVDAILRLGESLGLAAVAEGIEHPAQAERLRKMGCRAISSAGLPRRRRRSAS
jgi:EAL domain-containing protein (putative c-di-GMP-specific phosphodiesterase class I)